MTVFRLTPTQARSLFASFLFNAPAFLLPGRLGLQTRHRVLELAAGRPALAELLAGRLPFVAPPVGLSLGLRQRPAVAGGPLDEPLVACGHPARLPFADGSFDLVLAAHLFHHLDEGELRAALGEIERVLRPGGVLAAWDYASLSSHQLNRLHGRLLARGDGPVWLRGFGMLAHHASEAGFALIERPLLRPFLFPPIPRTALLAQKGDPDPSVLPVLQP